MINYDAIRKEIAIQHNVLFDKDDPLLIAASVNELILKECVKTLRGALEQGNIEAKKIAGRVIIEGGDYVSKQANIAVSSALEEGREQIRKDLRLAWQKVEASRKAAVTWAAVSSVCAAISVGALLAIVF